MIVRIPINPALLTASEVTAVIRAWLDSDDPTHWGSFEKSLDRAITVDNPYHTTEEQ
jgi:hypothetical protein